MSSLLIFIPTWNRSESVSYILNNYLPIIRRLKPYFCIDIVVSDNLSSDNTLLVLDKLQILFPFLIVNKMSSNSGLLGQYDYLFEHYCGRYDYVWIHGSDDFIQSDLLYSILLFVLTSRDKLFYLPVGGSLEYSELPGFDQLEPYDFNKVVRRIKFQFQFITSWISPFTNFQNFYRQATEAGLLYHDPHIFTHLSLASIYPSYIFKKPVISIQPVVDKFAFKSELDSSPIFHRIVQVFWRRFRLNWRLFESSNNLSFKPKLHISFILKSDFQLLRTVYSMLLQNLEVNKLDVTQCKSEFYIYPFYLLSCLLVSYKHLLTPLIRTYSKLKNYRSNA